MTGATVAPKATLRGRLAALLQALQLPADDAQIDGLLAHIDLIGRWNKVYNLTAVRHTDDMLTQHLADCLSVVASLQRHLDRQQANRASDGTWSLLDAGSGAGLPGLVLARMCPAVSVTCVDAVGKKAAFLCQVIAETGLSNARAVHGRVEEAEPSGSDVVVARAYASLSDLVQSTAAALRTDGVWMAMKGRVPAAEIVAVEATVDVFHVEPLQVPGLGAERCLVWMRKRREGGSE